jgi:hypothetical protein
LNLSARKRNEDVATNERLVFVDEEEEGEEEKQELGAGGVIK